MKYTIFFDNIYIYIYIYIYILYINIYINSLRNSGIKYIGKNMLRQFQNFSVCLNNTLAKNLVILILQWLRHISAFCQGLWFIFSWLGILVLLKLYCVLITHLNRWNGRQYFPCWSSCLGFFVCLCFGTRIHYPMLKTSCSKDSSVWKPR